MRVEAITVETAGDRATVTAEVTSPSWSQRRQLWIDVPSTFAGTGSLTAADPWIAAFLLPAMRAREELRVAAPASADLLAALPQIQTVYVDWMPSAAPIEVRADGDRVGGTRADGVALFFSCGVDSWYSLLKAEDRRQVGRSAEVTHLVNVHGVDIDVGDWKADVARAMADNTRRVAESHGLTPVTVATNLRHFYSSVGLSWHWGQAGALSAIALLLQDDFRRFVTAAGAITSAVATNPQREAGGCHPLLMPMFSTSRCELVVDGGEADRLRKLSRVVRSPLAMETLRVCWATHEPDYNCGRCAKCIRTTLELAAVGALGACPTLPGELDPVAIAGITALFPHEGPILEDRYRRLEAQGAHREVLDALQEGITRIRRAAEQRERGLDTIRATIPPDGPFALLDEDDIRFDLSRTHVAVHAFPERNGFFHGLPVDDREAVDEFRRARTAGAETFVIWKHDFWTLDYYPALREVLETECQLLASTPEVRIYEL